VLAGHFPLDDRARRRRQPGTVSMSSIEAYSRNYRFLMLTGQVLTAKEAKGLGLVAELVPRAKLLPRAWELAGQLAKKSDMLLRYTRKVLTHPLRKAIDDGLQYYLAMEALSTLDKNQR